MRREHCDRITRWMFAVALNSCLALMGGTAAAEAPESYRRLWNDAATKLRIERNIEKYRKGDAKIEVVGADGRPAAGARVEIRQLSHEFLFGCNAYVLGQFDTSEKNRRYEERFAHLFNFATVPFYWEGTEPVEGELRYAEGSRDIWRRPPTDRYIPFAARCNITLKGHPLLWHAYNPSWIPKDGETLKKLYKKRFSEIAARYSRHIKFWEVVNESLVCPETYPLYSPERAYVGWAFREAAALFEPDNVLMINEVNLSNLSAGEANPYYRQVKQLVAARVGVEGIGFQFHFFSADALNKALANPAYEPRRLLDVYESFADFNLPLYVTEITIPTPPGAGEAAQAELAGNFYRLWFSSPGMAGITWWNLGDGTAVKGENQARGGLVDDNLEPKESYRTLDRLINQEWKTRLNSSADAQGVVRFRGFYGKYSVTVTVQGRTQEFEIDLSRGDRASHRIKLTKPRG